jgi:uncharacterized protein (DUF433 family)
MINEDLLSRITVNPAVCHGKPTIRGLRYPVQNMLELLASGMSINDLLQDYRDLEEANFLACLQFSAKLMEVKDIHKLAS